MFWHLLLVAWGFPCDGKKNLFRNQLVNRPKSSKSGFLTVRVGLLPQVPGSRRLMKGRAIRKFLKRRTL
jgi:hypothetical protein